MSTVYPNYPATTFEQAVELAIFSSNQLHNILNSDATSTVETEGGLIPSVRKALVDNLYFKTPVIDWQQGLSNSVFNQLYLFYGEDVKAGLYYAPTANSVNPVVLGQSPEEDDNWRLYSYNTYSKEELNSSSGASFIGTSSEVTLQSYLDTLTTDIATSSTNLQTFENTLSGSTGSHYIGGLSSVTASSYGFSGSDNESTLATEFLNYCIDNNKVAVIDIPLNWDGLTFSRGGLYLTGTGLISGTVIIEGDLISNRSNSVTIGTANDYTTYPSGTTVFSGDFSSYAAGDKIVIELTSATGFSGTYNQIGRHFAKVTAASSNSLTIDYATRFAFDIFTISKTNFLEYSGDLAAGTYSISGDFSDFSAGDIVRFENKTGTDSVNAGTIYFEHSQVKSASSTTLVLVNPLSTAMGSPYIVKASFLKNINIFNANFEVLQLSAIVSCFVSNTRFTRSINGYIYNGLYSDTDIVASTPTGINFTYCRNVQVNNTLTRGATGTTDNAAFKMMSPVDCTVNGVEAHDYGVSSGSQSINGFMIDFLFTPYYNWGRNFQGNNINSGKNKGGMGFWLDGVKGGYLGNTHGGGDCRLYELVDFTADVQCDGGLLIRNPIRAKIKATANYIAVSGPQYLDIYPTTKVAGSSNSGRCLSFGGSSSGPWTTTIGNDVRIFDGMNYSTTAADTTLYFQNLKNLEVNGYTDISGLTYSANTSTSNVSGRIAFSRHNLQNAMNIGGYSGPNYIESDLAIGVKAATVPAYDRRRIRWGSSYLFRSSAGILFNPTGEPASSIDGLPLTMFTSVPATLTSGGQKGQIACDGAYLYVCYATNTWVKFAISSS